MPLRSSPHLDIERLRAWFLRHRRPLPWRIAPTPYSVWISEVMLQQTQVERVERYFARWMERFPTLHALAEASIDEVIKAWEGLGYYSRARTLHQAAQHLCTHCKGLFPNSREALASIKGLGPYTINALLAFAFHQKVAPVDANVVRVITRLFLIEEDITKSPTKQHIQQIADSLLPTNNPWEVGEALIELGAMHCRKKPLCTSCPLQQDCLAYKAQKQETLPYSTKKVVYEKLHRDIAIILSEDKALVRQVEEGKVFAGLWEFPYFTAPPQGSSFEELSRTLLAQLHVEPEPFCALAEEQQSFTRFRASLYPKVFSLNIMPTLPGYSWQPVALLPSLPFSSGHRRVLISFLQRIPQASPALKP